MINNPARRPLPQLALMAASLVYAANIILSMVTVGERWEMLWILILEICVFGLPAVVIAQAHGEAHKALRLERSPPVSAYVYISLAATAGALFMLGLLTMWTSLLASLGVNIDMLGAEIDSGNLLTALLVTAVAPAVCEELFYRGFLLTALEPLGGAAAIIISGMLFALAHGSVPGLPSHLIMGVTMAAVAYGTNSLSLAVVYHFTHNALLTGLSYAVGERQAPSGIASYILSPADTSATLIETAVLFGLFALLLRLALVSGRAPADDNADTAPPQTKRQPRVFWIGLFLLFFVMASLYAASAFFAYTG